MSIIPFGTSRDGFPMFQIGNVIGRNGTEYSVVVNLSRKNSLGKVMGGSHLAISTAIPEILENGDTVLHTMSWEEGSECGVSAIKLLSLWENVAEEALKCIFSNLTQVELAELAWRPLGNTQHTAAREDVHAHVQVATKVIWASGLIERLTDDARSNIFIVEEAVEAAIAEREQESARVLMELAVVATKSDLEQTGADPTPVVQLSSNDNVLDAGHPG